MTRSTLQVGGLRMPLLHAGPQDHDEAVVFVHGNPGSSQDRARRVERTGRFARAVAWDHPGFGRASKPEDFPYTVDGYDRAPHPRLPPPTPVRTGSMNGAPGG